MQDTKERPEVEETYTQATSASNLRFETREGSPTGAAGLLVAAGWSNSPVGALFMRLHSEWDGTSRPHRQRLEAIRRQAKDADGAQLEAFNWMLQEYKLLLQRLKTLPEARAAVAAQADKWKVHDPQGTAGAVIKYWLDQTCPACNGLKWKKTQGAPSLSNRVCMTCKGSGLAQAPHGMEGRRLLNYIDDCVNRARSSIRSRLGNTRKNNC